MSALAHDIEKQLSRLSPAHAAYIKHQLEWASTARLSQMPPEPSEQAEWFKRVNDGLDPERPRALSETQAEPWNEYGVQSGRGFGKGLALDTPIPAPSGWTTMGALKDGDAVLDCYGRPCRIEKAHEPYQPVRMYRLTFSDGTQIRADGDHLWIVVGRDSFPNAHFSGILARLGSEWHRSFGSLRNTDELAEFFAFGPFAIRKADGTVVTIREIQPLPPETVRCITIDAPEALYLAGEGMIPTHNTRMGAEWLLKDAWEDPKALPRCVIAPTQADVKHTCFEGVSGLVTIAPPEIVANYNRSELILELKNGGIIRGFSAEKPERLRGPEHASGWADELAAWGPDAEDVLDMFLFGLRIGDNPRFIWTSTPKPIPLVRKLTKPKKGRIIVRGSTYENKANLNAKFLEKLADHEGTRLGRQEIHGELIDPEEAGIIRRSWLRLWPASKALPKFNWIVMSLDTAFTEKTLDKRGDPDPSACSVWGIFEHEKRTNILLLDSWREHLNFPDLVRKTRREMNKAYGDDQDAAIVAPMFGGAKPIGSGRKPDIVIIEDKGSGISLRQALAASGLETYAYNPGRADKLARLHIVSPLFAQKRVWLPESDRTPGKPRTWCEPLIDQLTTFSGSGSIKHDDDLDACTQALRIAMDKGLLAVSAEPAHQQRSAEQEREAYEAREASLAKGYANPYDF